MQLVKWNPINNIFPFNHRLDQYFNDFFYPAENIFRQADYWNPATDVYENDDAYVIKVELPGLDKDHVHVDLKENILTIKGERSEESEMKGEKVYQQERFQGKFQRAFELPAKVESDKIEAEFTAGLLKIKIPKSKEEKPRQITIH
jgi:HSP20 family protein